MSNLLEFEFRHEDGRRWRLRMAHIHVSEWIEVEQLSRSVTPDGEKVNATELFADFLSGGMLGRKAFFWLARKREGDAARWDSDEMDPQAGELNVADITPETNEESTEEAGQDPPEAGASQ